MNSFLRLCVALLAILVASCGTSPPVHYYNLEAPVVTGTADGPDATMVGMGPFRIPEYLKKSRIVTRGAGTEILINEQARWAEPLNRAIHRVLAANVDQQMSDVIAVAYPYLETIEIDYAVLGQVERFDSDQSGRVLLVVQWGVVDETRHPLIIPQRSSYESRASDPNDPDQIARAMNDALNHFSQDIAGQLKKALAD
ncbi:MAG TPA: PqiC family protein [Xanthomonadales bacterium]|nr:PqiC family protein [Xanthomonadales bacterium]